MDTVADKVMWLDSGWDAVNTVIRPIAGAVAASVIAVAVMRVARRTLSRLRA